MVDTRRLLSIMSRSEDVQAAAARRSEIVNSLLEFLCDNFSAKELQHYRLISHLFSIEPVIKELCADSSTIEARTEKALACAMCALTIAMDDTPPPPTERQLERREARLAAKEFEEKVAGLKSAGKEPEPVSPVKPPSMHNKPRADLSPDDLERVRKSGRERQARWRAKTRAR